MHLLQATALQAACALLESIRWLSVPERMTVLLPQRGSRAPQLGVVSYLVHLSGR